MPKKTYNDSEQKIFCSRLEKLVNAAGGIKKFAGSCKLAPSTIHSYLHGADPSRRSLIAMAAAARVSVERLATGTATREDEDGYYPVKEAIPNLSGETDKQRPWSKGQVRIFFDQDTVKQTFRGAGGSDLILVRMDDSAMQPRIYRDEFAVVDANNDNIDDGIFVLFINGKFKIRSVAVLPDGGVRVFDCRKQPGGRTYSRGEFRRTVTIVGRVVISGHYPDINPE